MMDSVNWNLEEYAELVNCLRKNSDCKYKEFSKRIIFTKYEIIGVRTPFLRKLAKDINKTNVENFLLIKNKNTYEEILLEGFVIGNIKDVRMSLKYFNKYIKKIDCWSMCDQVISSMKIVKKYKDLFYREIKKYLNSKKEFIVRVGLVLLLNYYIEENYLDEIFLICDNLKRDEYYINMAISWLLSICYIKYKDDTLKYLKNNNLNKFVINKTISKICDSYRVSIEEKKMLKKMITT